MHDIRFRVELASNLPSRDRGLPEESRGGGVSRPPPTAVSF